MTGCTTTDGVRLGDAGPPSTSDVPLRDPGPPPESAPASQPPPHQRCFDFRVVADRASYPQGASVVVDVIATNTTDQGCRGAGCLPGTGFLFGGFSVVDRADRLVYYQWPDAVACAGLAPVVAAKATVSWDQISWDQSENDRTCVLETDPCGAITGRAAPGWYRIIWGWDGSDLHVPSAWFTITSS